MQLQLEFAPAAPEVYRSTTAGPINRSTTTGPTNLSTTAGSIYFVRQRRARRYLLRVDIDGRVRVTIPRGGSRRDADDFATRNLDWIRRQQSHYNRGALLRPALGEDERRAMQERARRELPPRLLELAALHDLTVRRVSIRNQRLRWGSCGRTGHICLNWRLVLMPDSVRDYVLIHELMHLRRMDHSPQFWAHVAGACTEYEAARQWLRANGPMLR